MSVSFAEGWDSATCRAFRPISRDEALERDRIGEPYVVLYPSADLSTPAQVHLIAWRRGFVGMWAYDDNGRRTRETDLRLLDDDRMFVLGTVERRYSSPAQADRAPDAWLCETEFDTSGKGWETTQERGEDGGAFTTISPVPPEELWSDRAMYGVRAIDESEISDEPGVATTDDPTSLWTPPTPMSMTLPLEDLFRPGHTFVDPRHGDMQTAAPRHIATVGIPSGRLCVAEPGFGEPWVLSEPVPPGSYLMEAAVLVRGNRRSEPAVRLRLRDEPAVSWDMARSEGDDPRLLLDGEAHCFGTDGATGSFADAAAWDSLSEKVRRFWEDDDETACDHLGDDVLHATDPATGAGLVSFLTDGDGGWPVWLGRSATGELVSVAVVVIGRWPALPPTPAPAH
ncbi:DUF4241 domain-containing protein [Streptomyces smaragdinus]|nr:DUF4241 domain-containing protein [Streptomyces smaragdinus]